jgi:hypothetical protein
LASKVTQRAADLVQARAARAIWIDARRGACAKKKKCAQVFFLQSRRQLFFSARSTDFFFLRAARAITLAAPSLTTSARAARDLDRCEARHFQKKVSFFLQSRRQLFFRRGRRTFFFARGADHFGSAVADDQRARRRPARD